jgi:hypothetical protein
VRTTADMGRVDRRRRGTSRRQPNLHRSRRSAPKERHGQDVSGDAPPPPQSTNSSEQHIAAPNHGESTEQPPGKTNLFSLPYEIREIIWKKALGRPLTNPEQVVCSKEEQTWLRRSRLNFDPWPRGCYGRSWEQSGPRIYSRLPPPLASVCRETRELALVHHGVPPSRRLDRRVNDLLRWETEMYAVELYSISRRDEQRLQLLTLKRSIASGQPVVLDIEALIREQRPNAIDVMHVIMQAADHQVKCTVGGGNILLISADRDPMLTSSSASLRGWAEKSPRLVDIGDLIVLRDLAKLRSTRPGPAARGSILPPELLTRILSGPETRNEIAAETLQPLQTLWNEMNAVLARKRKRKAVLRPLPKIDAVLRIVVLALDNYVY